MEEKYNKSSNYSFLHPKDFAFQFMMEEAFSRAIEIWLHLLDPLIPDDRSRAGARTTTAPRMMDELRAENPHYSNDQLADIVAARMLHLYLNSFNDYTTSVIPQSMSRAYGDANVHRNTFLIPEYAAYRDRGEMLLRHQWNHLASIMPFAIPDDINFDRYYEHNRFMEFVNTLATRAARPEDSILYWINFDAAGLARARLARFPEQERRYEYLPRDDEHRLNRVFQEMDPTFVPVNTSISFQRQLQEGLDRSRQL